MAVAHGAGRYTKLLAQWARTDVLVLDDLAMAPMSDQARRDLLEIPDDRHGSRSTIVSSQIPVDNWHEALGDPTLADAILTGSSTMSTAWPSMVNPCVSAEMV